MSPVRAVPTKRRKLSPRAIYTNIVTCVYLTFRCLHTYICIYEYRYINIYSMFSSHIALPLSLRDAARYVYVARRFRYRSPIWCYRYESHSSPTPEIASDRHTTGSCERSASLLTHPMPPTVFQPLSNSSISFMCLSCDSPFPAATRAHDLVRKFHY